MKRILTELVVTFIIILFCFISAVAQDPDVDIHVFQNGETWTECSFVLHPTLTQDEFGRYNKEAGSILYFQPLTGAHTLGKKHFRVSLNYEATPIDQTAGAWNNTFAHPDSMHWLGDKVQVPYMQVAFGALDNLDVGGFFTKAPGANFGFWGLDAKYSFIRDMESKWQAATRLSFSHLFGPVDLTSTMTAIDLMGSRRVGPFTPYAGASLGLANSREKTDAVDLGPVNAIVPRFLVGTELRAKWFEVAVEYDLSVVNTFSFRLGARF